MGEGGAPSLYRTLQGFSRRGHKVDFVAPTIGSNHHFAAPPEPPPAIEGVTYHLFRLPSLADTRLPLPALVRNGVVPVAAVALELPLRVVP